MSVLVAQLDSPGAQAVTTALLDRWQSDIATGIRQMQDRGKIDPHLEADHAAAAMLAGIQGGVLIMLSTGRLTNLEAALDVSIRHLRNGP